MRRTTVQIVAILALILAVVLTMALLKRDNGNEETSKPTSRLPSGSIRPAKTDSNARSSSRNPVPTAVPGSKAHQLIELKKRWIQIGERPVGLNSNDDLMFRHELSKETARILLCSEEAIELLQFLKKERILNSVKTEIGYLFKSDLAGEARQTLVSLPDQESSDGTNYRVEWSSPAGQGCPPEEFGEFCSALENPVCVQEAVFGHNVALVKTDPIGALNSTLKQIETGVASPTTSSSITDLIRSLPPDTDFEQVDKILSTLESEDMFSPFYGTKSMLIQAWAKGNPSTSADHIMANPDKYPVSNIEFPVMEALNRDLTTGIEWIQTFPDGPYFDRAATFTVSKLRARGNPKEAHQLASQIGNPEYRKEIMEQALKPFVRQPDNETE